MFTAVSFAAAASTQGTQHVFSICRLGACCQCEDPTRLLMCVKNKRFNAKGAMAKRSWPFGVKSWDDTVNLPR